VAKRKRPLRPESTLRFLGMGILSDPKSRLVDMIRPVAQILQASDQASPARPRGLTIRCARAVTRLLRATRSVDVLSNDPTLFG
jgi:hypothetical protein